jgi:hypothetical protein
VSDRFQRPSNRSPSDAVRWFGSADNRRLSNATPSARLRNRKQVVERLIEFRVEVVDQCQAANPNVILRRVTREVRSLRVGFHIAATASASATPIRNVDA